MSGICSSVDIGGIVDHRCLTFFRWEVIVCYVDIGRIVDHHSLTFFRWEVIVCCVDIGGIVDHHCLTFFRWEVIVCYVDIGGVVDHHCLKNIKILDRQMIKICSSNLFFVIQYHIGQKNWAFILDLKSGKPENLIWCISM